MSLSFGFIEEKGHLLRSLKMVICCALLVVLKKSQMTIN